MSVFSSRSERSGYFFLLLGGAVLAACAAASDEQGNLDEGTLTGAGTAGMTASGSSGTPTSAGVGGGGAPGGAGTSTNAGSGGSVAGMATAGGGAGGAASSGGSGGALSGGAGAGGGAGLGGTGGVTGDGYRYAKLVATSEQSGKPWSSCAELQLLTTGGAKIPRNDWLVTADSQESDDEVAPSSAVKDGDPATYWHTAWEPAGVDDAPLPHQLVIDTGKLQDITGFTYLPRQDGANGRIADYEFYLSKDGTNWGTAVKTGTFPNDATEQEITF